MTDPSGNTLTDADARLRNALNVLRLGHLNGPLADEAFRVACEEIVADRTKRDATIASYGEALKRLEDDVVRLKTALVPFSTLGSDPEHEQAPDHGKLSVFVADLRRAADTLKPSTPIQVEK